jgi:hypothetical protein
MTPTFFFFFPLNIIGWALVGAQAAHFQFTPGIMVPWENAVQKTKPRKNTKTPEKTLLTLYILKKRKNPRNPKTRKNPKNPKNPV